MAEFQEQLALTGRVFGDAGVDAVYLVHGTFVGNDILGLLTELSRFAPQLSRKLSRIGKGVIDCFTGEAGNYTQAFATALREGLSAGAVREIPVKLFNWSSQNNHIARADGAIRLIAELAKMDEKAQPRRVLIWGHSHGGNVMALVSQLLGADQSARDEFFAAARSYFHAWVRGGVDMPHWQEVEELLKDEVHPVRQLQLDMVTFGTPIRYGWNSGGYANLLHFVHHRPPQQGGEHNAPIPLKPMRACQALDGDYVQQIGISGTNFAPLPIAVRTLIADWRLDRLLETDVVPENIIARLRRAMRVPDEGTTLLVDYTEISPWVTRHIFGHGLYTLRKWLPYHCQQIAASFYSENL
ncbi:MAG: hypothetical protein AAGD11_01085 [Planctomycetota bacterium]